MTKTLLALIINPNLKVLGDLVRPLSLKGFRIAARPAPEDALEYVRRARPDLVLLGAPYWQEGWARRIVDASPATVVVPVPVAPPASGAA